MIRRRDVLAALGGTLSATTGGCLFFRQERPPARFTPGWTGREPSVLAHYGDDLEPAAAALATDRGRFVLGYTNADPTVAVVSADGDRLRTTTIDTGAAWGVGWDDPPVSVATRDGEPILVGVDGHGSASVSFVKRMAGPTTVPLGNDGGETTVGDVAWHPDGHALAAGGRSGTDGPDGVVWAVTRSGGARWGRYATDSRPVTDARLCRVDDGFVVAADTGEVAGNAVAGRPLLAVFDHTGEQRWERRVRDDVGGDYVGDVTPAHDGGVVVAGWTTSPVDAAATWAPWVGSFDGDGGVRWMREFLPDRGGIALGVTSTPDGRYAIGGRRGSDTSEHSGFVLGLDGDGRESWRAVADYGSAEGTIGSATAAVDTTRAGDVVAFGRAGLDPSTDPEWAYLARFTPG